ncbi:Rieske (2Fe-2S) protein [Amycolatopsis suaedae]|uniref:Cytochrome bc1 complex Rieske iron-sulfur subunit n=1 Tax=Amycolatopsis suaedae TaxID=2510978 RepID=A0A4Q7JDR8_9PSEU|nr:Rieske (2Fe-2S) protein [Amycolatopsis suaedae]RZQ65609.1 Rieske (2Fe-2S) protein [Amycolatopsis suaedae]
MTAELHTRRTALTAGAAVAAGAAGMVTLAACGSDEPATGPNAPLAALNDIPVGQAKIVAGPGDEEVVVARPTESTAAAFSATCTHQGCKVKAEGASLTCPCHGSVFDALTGAVRTGPADKPLPAVPVKVENGQILSA